MANLAIIDEPPLVGIDPQVTREWIVELEGLKAGGAEVTDHLRRARQELVELEQRLEKLDAAEAGE